MKSPPPKPVSDLPRQNTYTRAYTFDNTANGFTRTSTMFGRMITDTIGLTYETEEQQMHSLIAEYVRVAEKGVDGDMPLPAGFAREYRFWRMMFYAGLFGCFMGVLGACFLNVADETPKFWTNHLERAEAVDLEYWRGEQYWIYVPMGAGFIVGVLRYFMNYPEQVDGLFKEINHYHVDWKIAPQTILLSLISLAGGASLGPEQALGTVGGGLATFLLDYLPDLDADDRKLLVLVGMTAAIGALFPSPILTVLMIFELGHPPRTTMESVTILSFAASISFMIFYAIVGTEKTWLEPVTNKGVFLALTWEYDNTQCITGAVLGIMAGCLSITSIIFIGFTKQIFFRIRKRLERFKFLQSVLPPTIAGLIIGTFNYAMPLTVGNGNIVLPHIIKYGMQGTLSTHTLITAGFARILLLGVSMTSVGYVGGFIFPTLTIAIIAGVICYQQYSYLPYGLCIGCFLAGMPAGICPMPFTLSCLAIFLFFFGIYQTAPILLATITSYTVVCGSGLFSALQSRAKKQEEERLEAEQALLRGEDPKVAAATAKAELKVKDAEATLSLNRYLEGK